MWLISRKPVYSVSFPRTLIDKISVLSKVNTGNKSTFLDQETKSGSQQTILVAFLNMIRNTTNVGNYRHKFNETP